MNSRPLATWPARKKLVLGVLFGVQVGLVGVAHYDISHRDEAELNGSKAKWRAITLLNFVGPIWYFWRGRRPHGDARPRDVAEGSVPGR